MRLFLRGAGLAGALFLAGCATQRPAPPPVTVPPPVQPIPIPPPPANAASAGVVAESPRAIDPATAERALAAFRLSCPVLVRRSDRVTKGQVIATLESRPEQARRLDVRETPADAAAPAEPVMKDAR